MGQIGNELRTAIYGWEVSKLRRKKTEYPIQVRYAPEQRTNINKIYQRQDHLPRHEIQGNSGQIPISSVATMVMRRPMAV